MTIPIPALNPMSTGSEMKFATNPRRRNEAAVSNSPTSRASVAVARMSVAVSPSGAISASSDPTRIAMVVVVDTLRTRDVPRRA